MTVLRPAPVSAAQLTWSPSTATFSGEISSTYGFDQVYDDAADEGLTLVFGSGVETVFAIEETHRDAEGDITHWTLRNVTPRFRPTTLILFND